MILLLFSLLISACGYRGPLYLPDEPATENVPASETIEAEDEEEKEEGMPALKP